MASKMQTLLKIPTSVARVVIVIVNNIYCIPTYLLWMGLLSPLKIIQPTMFYKIEGIFFHWMIAVVSMWSYSAGYDIIEVGDDIEECLDKKTLVIANHQSTGDVPLLMANFNAKESVVPNIMWIMDRLFKYTNFGAVSLVHEDFFISSGRQKRERALDELKTHLTDSFNRNNRKWMVLFPEGGFLHKRRAVSQRYIEKMNLPPLEYVTLPRVGALKAIFDVMVSQNVPSKEDRLVSCDKMENGDLAPTTSILLTNNFSSKNFHQAGDSHEERRLISPSGDMVKTKNSNHQIGNSNAASPNMNNSTVSQNNFLEYILDITIAYPDRKPVDLPNIIHGWREPCKTHMLYRLYKVSKIPTDVDELTQWLYDRFYEKNNLLENFYKSGQFYINRTVSSNVIHQDNLRLLLINLFFITSTYFHYQILSVCYKYCVAYIAQNVS